MIGGDLATFGPEIDPAHKKTAAPSADMNATASIMSAIRAFRCRKIIRCPVMSIPLLRTDGRPAEWQSVRAAHNVRTLQSERR